MERRNFLGLSALLGLIPFVPKNILTEEQGVPGIVKAQLADGTELEFGEPLKLSEEFEISITEQIQIKVGHKNQYGRWYQIIGKGILDGDIVTFKTEKIEEGTNAFNNPPTIWINGTQKAKLISVRSSQEPIYIQCWGNSNDQVIPGRSETVLTCQKI